MGFNYNENSVIKQFALPAQVTNAAFGQTAILGPTALSALTTATPREKVVLGAFYTLSKWSANLRESIYGPTSEIVSTSGTGVDGVTERIGVTPITDLEVDYALTRKIKLALGANNLFDTKPPSVPLISNGAGGVRPADGGDVYSAPDGFSPFGINGGYYYGRVTYSF